MYEIDEKIRIAVQEAIRQETPKLEKEINNLLGNKITDEQYQCCTCYQWKKKKDMAKLWHCASDHSYKCITCTDKRTKEDEEYKKKRDLKG